MVSKNAEQYARQLAERIERSPRHTAEVKANPVDIDGRFIGTQWGVFIHGKSWFDRSGCVFWFQPAKGRAYLSGGYLSKYGKHRNDINLGRYDYRTLNLWLAVCVDSYAHEDLR